jgi:gallidermin-class lantibiotic protection ABC transporter ATP-binding subunit
MNQNILETKCLTKSFRSHRAVDRISLAVPRNCVYGLLGPNGAGKSTLLKMMTGILRPTDGEILFDGHTWSRKDLGDIGALIETPPVYENLTAWENLKVRGLMLGISDQRIRDVLELVDLAGTGKKKAGAFSLGMKQRLGIGIALLSEPKLLVLDEPVNGLDPIGIQELRQMIRQFPEEGITVIVSSHILGEIAKTADYIGIIADGALGYQGGMPDPDRLEELFMKVAAKKSISHEIPGTRKEAR